MQVTFTNKCPALPLNHDQEARVRGALWVSALGTLLKHGIPYDHPKVVGAEIVGTLYPNMDLEVCVRAPEERPFTLRLPLAATLFNPTPGNA